MAEAAAATIVAFVKWAGATIAGLSGGTITAAEGLAIAVKAWNAGVQIALLASANAVIANQNRPEIQGGLINLAISPNEPRRLILGRRMTGGVLADWQIKGSKNQNLFMVIYLSEGPCGDLKKVLAGGRVVYDGDVSGAFVHGVRKTIPDFRSGGDRLWCTYYDGRAGQTADAYMQAEFPGVWTANHKGTGCAYVIVEAQWDSDNLTSPPSLSFELDGSKLYDRRKDSTAGGSGAHRYNDPSTWELSTNPAVALDHYMLGRISNGVKTFGIGVDPANVLYADFAAQANLCDELVPLKAGGTQKRYEANGYLFADRTFKDTILDLCRAMAARPADKGGQISLIDGMPKTPVMTLTENDLVYGTSEQYRPKQSWADLVSGVQGTYIDARQNYQPTDYPIITNPTWDAEDNGQPKLDTIDFEMEVSQERAERLALLHAQTKRRQARLTGVYGLKAIQLEQGDWFTRSGGKFGGGKVFEIINRTLDVRTLTVTLAAFEVDPADSAWDEASATDIAPVTIPSVPELPALGLPGVTVTPFAFTEGALTFPALRFENPDFADVVPYGVNIEYGISTSGVLTGETFTHIMPPGQEASTVYGLLPNRTYVVRAQSYYGALQGAWTSWVEISTTLDYTAGVGGGDGDLAFLDFVSLGTNVRLGDGLTSATDALLRTSLGTASGILGQGTFATLNSITSGLADTNNLLRRSAGGLFTGALAADVTSLNTAAGFTGQGALATLGFTTLGSNVRLGDGITSATDGLLRTSLGTAANIAGQGSFATLSAINSTIANANNLLQRTGGGVFTGSLNADLTSLNTAAAIVGQGPGATGAQELVMNLYSAYGVRKGFNFTSSLEGAVPNGTSTLTWVAGVAVWVTTAGDPHVATTINLAGRSVPKVRVRMRPTSASFSWEGTLYYSTSGHGYSGSFYKTIAAPVGLAQNVWVIAEWDMTALTLGGTDWVDNTIISTRFDFSNLTGETWEIDWIAFGDFGADPVGIRNIADNADPTGSNTAANITGQGALATSGFVALGSTVRLSDGVTVATNSLLLTSAGTAAGFAGQGALATLSAVGTVNVSANAISIVAAAYTAGTGGASAVGDGWTNYQSITITTTGGPVLITASGFATIASDTAAVQSVRVRRGTTLIYGGGSFNQSYGADQNMPFSATIVDQPAAGTYTYYLQGTVSGSDISINQWADRAMTATELKR